MKIKLTKGTPAMLADIQKLEREIGGTLPNSFVEFASQYDGGEPEANIFNIGDVNQSGVNGFIPVCEILAEMANIEELPRRGFPVAWAEGGNYVFIDAATGIVYFWDHELPDQTTQIASDFAAFLALLKPFDASAIKPHPGQVMSVWIKDPDFLKNLE